VVATASPIPSELAESMRVAAARVATTPAASAARAKMEVADLWIRYGSAEAVKGISLTVREHEILGIIGPANSGKTSFLRSLNRLNDLETGYRSSGQVLLNGQDTRRLNVDELRRRIGMVFALPVVLPMSIFDNVVYGPRRHGLRDRRALAELVEQGLRSAYLWEEVKDRLHEPASHLSGGQQQRLCIARTLAVDPEMILFDEPCSGLDPISTAKVEEAMLALKQRYTQILVTNNTKQAARVCDRVAFFLMGELVELDETSRLFTKPKDARTEGYIEGRFG